MERNVMVMINGIIWGVSLSFLSGLLTGAISAGYRLLVKIIKGGT